jgi:hypothetical protein
MFLSSVAGISIKKKLAIAALGEISLQSNFLFVDIRSHIFLVDIIPSGGDLLYLQHVHKLEPSLLLHPKVWLIIKSLESPQSILVMAPLYSLHFCRTCSKDILYMESIVRLVKMLSSIQNSMLHFFLLDL